SDLHVSIPKAVTDHDKEACFEYPLRELVCETQKRFAWRELVVRSKNQQRTPCAFQVLGVLVPRIPQRTQPVFFVLNPIKRAVQLEQPERAVAAVQFCRAPALRRESIHERLVPMRERRLDA